MEKFLKDVYQFEGRLSKKKYFKLTEKIFYIVIISLIPCLATEFFSEFVAVFELYMAIEMILLIFVLVGMSGIIIRRLHDMDKTGWKILVPIIVGYLTEHFLIVWLLYHLYLSCWEGTDGANKYGEKPPDDDES